MLLAEGGGHHTDTFVQEESRRPRSDVQHRQRAQHNSHGSHAEHAVSSHLRRVSKAMAARVIETCSAVVARAQRWCRCIWWSDCLSQPVASASSFSAADHPRQRHRAL